MGSHILKIEKDGYDTLVKNIYIKENEELDLIETLNLRKIEFESNVNNSTSFYIGQNYGGGIIFFVDNTGKHGLVAATKNLEIADWKKAKSECESCTDNGYSDWRLPSKHELNLMYENIHDNGGFSGTYWSSSEYNASLAWGQGFDHGNQVSYGKNYTNEVRAVRSF